MYVVNAPFYSSPSFILTLLNPHLRSIFVNTFLLSILSINSIINRSGVTLQVNFLQKITFDMLYTNKFVIRVCSRALSILSERTTI